MNVWLTLLMHIKDKKPALSLWRSFGYLTFTMYPVIGLADVAASYYCTGSEPYTRVYANISSPLMIKTGLNVGEVISSTIVSVPYGMTTTGCTVKGPGYFIGNGTGTPSGNLYPTSIPGISYRIKIISGWTVPGFIDTYWPVSTYVEPKSGMLIDGSYAAFTAEVDLVKTGPYLGQSILSPSILGHVDLSSNGSLIKFIEIYNATPVETIPDNPSCKVTQSAIPVSLEDVSTNKLDQVGSTSKETAFTIPLACTASANISLSFSGVMADSDKAVFSNLNSGTNASQVGVQILSGTTPVPIATGSYLNIGQVNGNISIPLVARYYALTSNPNAGAVNSIVYATLVYN